MSWQKIKTGYYRLSDSIDDKRQLDTAWIDFSALVNSQPIPYHLSLLLSRIESFDVDKCDISILDHGCGGALTLLYLAALGYTNIFGVDISTSACERWNRLTSEIFGYSNQRFFAYDGFKLPLEDDSIDIVFSQQVLEHVRPEVLNSYYTEEVRVLKPGGLAFHSVPHRLVPYDSHTQTWLCHYFLPREAWLYFLKLLGKDSVTAREALYLRWPGEHIRIANKYFEVCEDVTQDRLQLLTNFEYYDGSLRLRLLIVKLISFPVLGKVFRRFIAKFMMLDTISIKSKNIGN